MRINIKGNDISPEKIAAALARCEKEYNLKIAGATIYVRFENSSGQIVEPLQDGEEFSRDFWFQKRSAPVPSQPAEPVEQITVQEMVDCCQKAASRMLSSPEITRLIELERRVKVDRKIFCECLNQVVQRSRYFKVYALVKLVEQRCR